VSLSLKMTLRTMTVAGIFTDMTIRTSVVSEHSHRFLFLFIFCSWVKFFSLDLKSRDSGVLQPGEQLPRLLHPPSFGCLRHELAPPHGVGFVGGGEGSFCFILLLTVLSPVSSLVVIDRMDLLGSASMMLHFVGQHESLGITVNPANPKLTTVSCRSDKLTKCIFHAKHRSSFDLV
jgi:hypothetical protein